MNIPYHAIRKVEHIAVPKKDRQDFLDASILRDCNLVLELKYPLEAIGYYGMRRRFSAVGLKIDDVMAFTKNLNNRIESNK